MSPPLSRAPAHSGMPTPGGSLQAVPAQLEPGVPLSSGGALVARARRVLAGCRGAEARIVAAEARLLDRAHKARVCEALGYPTLPCFAREELKIDGRTARDRVALNGVMARWPALEQAFLAGRLSAGHLLTLRSVLRGAEFSPGRDTTARRPGEMSDETGRWVALAERLSLGDFRRCLREAAADGGGSGGRASDDIDIDIDVESDTDEERELVTFEAPLVAARAWELGIETARRVLGRTASVAECVESMLVEAAPGAVAEARLDGEGPPPGPDDHRGDCGAGGCGAGGCGAGGVRVGGPVPGQDAADRHGGTRLIETLDGLGKPKGHGAGLQGDGGDATPLTPRWRLRVGASLAAVEGHLRALDEPAPGGAESPRKWLARWRALRVRRGALESGLHRLLADLRDSGLLDTLGYARLSDLAESELGYSPRGARHLVALMNRLHGSPALARVVARGAIGTVHAFLIARHVPLPGHHAWARRAEVVSVRQLERELRLVERCAALDQRLGARVAAAWPDPGMLAGLAAELSRRSGGDPERVAHAANVFRVRADPAARPDLMRRLEGLLDTWEEANHESELTRIEKPPLTRVIRLRLPRFIARAWGRVTSAWAPLPAWAAAVLLVDRATAVWVARHRDAPPVEDRLLERDDYRCQAPGCGARSGLEVHHIVPRAQGGSNAAANRITLCHWHHHRGLHTGLIRLAGRAPDRLHWEMPLGRWQGELRVGAAAPQLSQTPELHPRGFNTPPRARVEAGDASTLRPPSAILANSVTSWVRTS